MVSRLVDGMRTQSVGWTRDIGKAASERMDRVRRQWAEALAGAREADVTVRAGVDELHMNRLVEMAKRVLLPEADSMCAFLYETMETGKSTIFMANVRGFAHIPRERNKYLIVECDKIGSDVRRIFVDSLFLLIK